MPLMSQWTSHIKDPEKKAEFSKLLRHSTMSLGRLQEIVKESKEGLLRTERSAKAFENPNWAFAQAHTNGMLQAYDNMLKLLSFLDDEEQKANGRR